MGVSTPRTRTLEKCVACGPLILLLALLMQELPGLTNPIIIDATITADEQTQDKDGVAEQPSDPKSILDQKLTLHGVRISILELTRKLHDQLGTDFRCAYPARVSVLTDSYIDLDTRKQPQPLSAILDAACDEVGIEWRWHDGAVLLTIPLSPADEADQRRKWADTNADMETRVRAARRLANAGYTDTMPWLFEKLKGKLRRLYLSDSELGSIAEHVLFSTRPDALQSPYILVGDDPRIAKAIRETMRVDPAYGLALAVAANVRGLENEIVTGFISGGLRSPTMGASTRELVKRRLDRNDPFFIFDHSRIQLRRLEDQYIRIVASVNSVDKLLETLPQSRGYFRQRIINNLGWRPSEATTQVLNSLATSILHDIVEGRKFPTLQDAERQYPTNNLDQLQSIIYSLMRHGDTAWTETILSAINPDPLLASPVQEALIPTLTWDQGPTSATALIRYIDRFYGSDDLQESRVGDLAMETLSRRYDRNTLAALRQIMAGQNSTAADFAARILARRYEEDAARRLADSIANGQHTGCSALFASRLPWVPEYIETLIVNGDKKLWKTILRRKHQRAHRSTAGDNLIRKIVTGPYPEDLRLTAIGPISRDATRDPTSLKTLQMLVSDPLPKVRKAAIQRLTWGGPAQIRANRLFLIETANTGNLEVSGSISKLLHFKDVVDEERKSIYDFLFESANSESPALKATAIRQLKGLWNHFQSELEQRIEENSPLYPVIRDRRRNTPNTVDQSAVGADGF